MVDFKDIIANEVYDESLGLTLDEIRGLIEIPNDEKMGDYAFPCFRLAKALRKAPQMIAADIAATPLLNLFIIKLFCPSPLRRLLFPQQLPH